MSAGTLHGGNPFGHGAPARPTSHPAPPSSVDALDSALTPGAAEGRTPTSPLVWALGVVIALVLLWRIVAVNLSAQFVQNAIDDPDSAAPSVASAVSWDAHNADALVREAAGKMESDPPAATALAQRALRANPATGPAYLVLAGIAAKAGDTGASIAYYKRAAELEPQNPTTRLELADLALSDRDIYAALDNIDAALRSRPDLSATLFPKMVAIVAQPGGDAAVRKLLARKIPDWWPAFFSYASTNAPSPLLALQLLDARRAYVPNPPLNERAPLIDRLAKAGEWNAALMVWLNGLTPEQRSAAGNVFNGSFEAPFSNTTFDWQWPQGNGADVAALSTFGTGGGKALRVAFQGQVSSPQLVRQTLLLQPGFQYDLRGRSRLESLRTAFGVEWQVSCGVSGGEPIATTDRLVGTSDWKEFNTTFSVPADCYPQQLALVLRGDAKLDLQATGLAWYDEIQLVRGSEVSANTSNNPPAAVSNSTLKTGSKTTGKQARK